MEGTPYYSITTKKYQVLFRHMDWLHQTQELYNAVLKFYYDLYLEYLSDSRPGTMEALRSLEKMTIKGRDKQEVPVPFPWKKVPLYFRRAAANTAIGAARSFLSRPDQGKPTEEFLEPVTFYKGMYREFQQDKIQVKLWTGEKWQWAVLKLRGNSVPQKGRMMSPALQIRKNQAELHIPFKLPVEDGRSFQERMEAGERICSVVFTNQDACAVCCILEKHADQENEGLTEKAEMNQISCCFLRGGKEYAHLCRQTMEKIEKSQNSCGTGNNPKANRKYWDRLRNLTDYYSHGFSRQILEFCKKHQAKILVLPEHDSEYSRMILSAAGRYSPIYLSRSIREKLKHKAWQEGIVTVELQQHDIRSRCSQCGSKVQLKGSEYLCPEGHRGNRYLNSARNLGKKCLEEKQKR